MFLLFGFGKKTVKGYGSEEVILCQRCNNAKQWQYRKTKTWFTLFFIPVIPYQTSYEKVCPICGNSVTLSKDDFYGGVEEIQVIEGQTKSEASRYKGMTKTQVNYRKEVAAVKTEKAQGAATDENKRSLESLNQSDEKEL